MAHTPGPFEAPGQDGEEWVVCTHKSKGRRRTVAHAYTRDDAHLFAAAPDMLSVLRDLFENPQFQVGIGGNPIMVEKLMQRARAAIAKASGE